MFQNTLKQVYQKIWVEGQIDDWTNYIGQVSWLLFLRYLESIESDRKDQAALESKEYVPILDKEYRWDHWACPKNGLGVRDKAKAITGDDLIKFVNNKLFPYFRSIKNESSKSSVQNQIASIFEKLENKFDNGYELRQALNRIDDLTFNTNDQRDELGNIYEEMLQKLDNKGAGKGEYYTPRPLIRAMVTVINPQIGETVYDGACGTCGFL